MKVPESERAAPAPPDPEPSPPAQPPPIPQQQPAAAPSGAWTVNRPNPKAGPPNPGLLLLVTSHDSGKNARVEIYPDRIERRVERRIGKGKRAAEMIPMRSVSSVRTQKDGLRYTKVLVDSSGSTIVFRTSHGDAQRMHETLTHLLLDHDQSKHAPVVHAPAPAPVEPASVAGELTKLVELRDAGVLTPDEFETQKARLLG